MSGHWIGWRWRLWRHWCLVKAIGREAMPRLVFLSLILFVGGLAFQAFEPRPERDFAEAMFFTFSLVFGQAPEGFPSSWTLRVLFFVVPILGLTVIIEGIVDLATLLRDRRRSEQSWSRIMAQGMTGHVVLIGLGKLGYRAFTLLRAGGDRVAVIELDPNARLLDDVRADGSPIFIGDATRESLLEQAGIRSARAVLITTNNDLANLEIAMDARRLAPNVRIVVRLFDQRLADKFSRIAGVECALSQSAISAPSFVDAALGRGGSSSVMIEGRPMSLRWVTVDADLAARFTHVEALAAHYASAAIELQRSDGSGNSPPRCDEEIVAGDRVLFQRPL